MGQRDRTTNGRVPFSRRQILRGSAAAAMAAPLAAAPSIHGSRRPSDELRVAVAGVRGRGGGLINGVVKQPGVHLAAICDVDRAVLASRSADLEKRLNRAVDTAVDLRLLLARDDIDAVVIATPNHLHALHTMWACEAGKDVYVEKPISHNLHEGAQMVKAARMHGRIVQSGTQSRSSHALRDAIGWLREGNLGAVTHGWGTCFKPRLSIGKVDGPQAVPESVDYGLYMGPRGERPLTRGSLHYDWHWQSPTGNGDLGNQGVHQIDQARWALGHDALPRSVISIGGRFGYDDDGDTANTLLTFFDFPGTPLIFEVRGLPGRADARADGTVWRGAMEKRLGMGMGSTIHAEGGSLCFPNYTTAEAFDAAGRSVKKWKGTDDHMANFIAAVRSRDAASLNASVLDGHRSSALAHMGNDSFAVGEAASRREIERAVASEPLLAHGVDRMLAHLDANGIDLDATPITFGARLEVDPKTGLYAGHDAANARAMGEYVEGFTLPEVN